MRWTSGGGIWLSLATAALWVNGERVCAQSNPEPRPVAPAPAAQAQPVRPVMVDPRPATQKVQVEGMSPAVRERVRKVLEQPTLFAHGPTEVFPGRIDLYEWLLDRPDLAAAAWRRLGAPCSEISERGQGAFAWNDGSGSEIVWQCVLSNSRQRVWLAEGKVRPALLMPAVPVQAVVVLRYGEGKDRSGRPVIRHQAELFFQTDSKTAAMVAKLLGASAPQMAEQCMSQLEMFFSALVWYCDQHPERAPAILGKSS